MLLLVEVDGPHSTLSLSLLSITTAMPVTPSPASRYPLATAAAVSRLSTSSAFAASALQQLPSNYLSLAKSLVAIAVSSTPLLSTPAPPLPRLAEADEVAACDTHDYFDSRRAPHERCASSSSSDSSGDTLPPPSYATSPPPTPAPARAAAEPGPCGVPHPSSRAQVVSRASSASRGGDGGCASCSQLQLQLHLLTLQNEAYLAQRDYLLQQQQLPVRTSASSSPASSQGLLALVIAMVIRALFLVAFLLWPLVVRVLGKAREWESEWEIGGRVWKCGWRCVGMAWAFVSGAGRERLGTVGGRARAEWEVWAARGLEEIFSGVGQGVREGLGVWGVRVEGMM